MRTAVDEMGVLRTAVAGSQPVQTVGQVRQTITSVRAKIDTAQQVLTAARNSDNLVQLTLALSQIESELQGVPDATPITEVQARISASATTAAEQATALYDAVCAAK